MSHVDPIATGTVISLAINGKRVLNIEFKLTGPVGDNHSGFDRHLSGHDGNYIKTSDLMKGAQVFN